ncbi:MAG: LEM-3-like GIY-YIG domain-containing protein [Aeromonas sp.]|uniref:LEM-3-like GIY-YIG domain-containing protein n=1 Tax=Aeromonas sp. TaxID=647 RepID=UPI003F392611
MNNNKTDGFPKGVAEKLKTYVYRLIDPRNGETFYVGKGVGDRVFAHIREEGDSEDPSNKLKRIREIHLAGLEVGHVIHRHGMDDNTAFEVEAALIEAYPGLTNIAGGMGNGEFGVMHATEIIRRYAAKPAVIKHKALLITINRSAAEHSIYEATRYAWKLSRVKVEEAELVLATIQGMIVGAFVPEQWLPATPEHFPGREPMTGRLGFFGHEAPENIRSQYVGRSVPKAFQKKGAANPVKYSWGKAEQGE